MGWLELNGWLVELGRRNRRRAGQDSTDPDSWSGYEHDAWWAEQRAEADRLRGR